MLFEITTTHQPATDLGYLLGKHPDRVQNIDLAEGKAQIFYKEASENRCTACLLLDINPLKMVKGKKKGPLQWYKENYVNDRPYASNSFMSTAISKAYSSAINGSSKERAALAATAIPLDFQLTALKVGDDPKVLDRLFHPLGYEVTYEQFLLDERFPDWGYSPYINLQLSHNSILLSQALSQIYVLMSVLDNERHYWITQQDVQLLLRRGEGWLDNHPEKEWITRRFLKNLKSLTQQATSELSAEAASIHSQKISLHQKRLEKAVGLLLGTNAQSILDLGCGEGKLMKLLLKYPQFKQITGVDVSIRELQKAKEELYWDEASPVMRERMDLFQAAATYRDPRLRGFDAIAMIEVIEHLDLERLPAMEQLVFGYSKARYILVSTPNAEYNAVFEKMDTGQMRHDDHRFEWTREEFENWCEQMKNQWHYNYEIHTVGEVHPDYGAPSQMALFRL